ncbi:hypothetical protein [Sedimentitalea todarodis]|uniref:Outer membrane beta-barrel protein n=1 Tax=Sedimentitalea todarodis TaxID=1631240 RepID=A0ABU3VAG2_9RHOB|nr:hypothetical protein [Sedimentitalea todarodis]MDU9003158.1 hypothetical protein [Sedimentitalea todarodis]
MSKCLIRSAAIVGLTATAVPPAYAQDEEEYGSIRQRIRVEQNFIAGDNLGLESPSEGRTSLSTTRLTYGLQRETATQQLSLAVGAGLRFGNIATGNTMKTGFVDPLIAFRYNREGANALFSFDADYQQTDISLDQPLWTFLDSDGIVTPPADFSDIRGSGERRAYNVGAFLETGLNDPFGLRLRARTSGTNYIDTTDADLDDYDNTSLGLTGLFRFNPVTTATVDLSYLKYSSADSADTDRETRAVQAGFIRELSSISTLTFSAGFSTVDSTLTDPITGVRSTTRAEGPVGGIDYDTAMPNGTFNVGFDVYQNQDGQRGTLLMARSLELPSGSLSGNIGVTQLDQSDPQVIGGLNWVYNLPSSRFTLILDRAVYTDSSDEDRLTNLLVAGYSHEINQVSSLSVDLSMSYTEAAVGEDATERAGLVVAYNRELNENWSFNTGVAFRTLQDNDIGEADATALFFGIGRNFDLSR